jgi:hypothetical protein
VSAIKRHIGVDTQGLRHVRRARLPWSLHSERSD